MKIVVIGSGAREHALAWKLSLSNDVSEVICTPGNGGTQQHFRSLDLQGSFDAQADQLVAEKPDLVVIGPEGPLCGGLTDRLERRTIPVFGPNAAAAKLEGSKVFAKEFMKRHRIPTADFSVERDADLADEYIKHAKRPLVIKADGLAAGKGVVVASSADEAHLAVDRMMRKAEFGDAGKQVVIENCLVGEEISYHVLTDGQRYTVLPPTQDHKRLLEGDRGPNTGGMGAYSPAAIVTADLDAKIRTRIIEPTLKGLAQDKISYRGALFAGLMIVDNDPYLLEYNVRFGDPETEVMLMRTSDDIVPLLSGVAAGNLPTTSPRWDVAASLCVVIASHGYPGTYDKGVEIHGLESVNSDSHLQVFHAGTQREGERMKTSGGRVLTVTASGESLEVAFKNAYAAVEKITFDGMQYRKDIAWRARGGAHG